MSFDLRGKRSIVIGSSGNLGPIWVDTLWEAGAFVNTTFDKPGWDVSNRKSVYGFHQLYHYDGSIPDIIVYNAAIDSSPTNNQPTKFFDSFAGIMAVNITGAANVCEQFIPDMIENGGGVIITIGSIQGVIGADYRNYDEGWEKQSGYNCSKAALSQLTRSIAVQYGRYNIRAVTIAFGCVDTGKVSDEFAERFNRNVPLGRLISKESLVTTLLYACSCPELTGQTIMVDGGYTIL